MGYMYKPYGESEDTELAPNTSTQAWCVMNRQRG